ncbi:MAG: zinc ribbon domain-containing protein [Chloroflexia bacterium]|nr:zinc ribbon domain-containing protein [Chloroflexia bacterium]
MDIETLIARGLQVLLALGGAYLIALWFALAVWTFRDIETRSRSVITQVFSTLLVVLFWIPGLLLYRLLRPSETLDEAYQRSLEEEYLIQDLEELPLCPSCNHFVEDDFQICPNCNTQLREACTSCERLIDLRWEICPYCGTHHHGGASHTEQAVELSGDRWVDPTSIERRLRESEERRVREETRALPAATAATTLAGGLLGEHDREDDRFRERVVIGRGEGEKVPVGVTQHVVPSRPDVLGANGAADSDRADRDDGPDLSGLGESESNGQHDESDTAATIPKRYRVT